MTIKLTRASEQIIDQQIRLGRFSNQEAVVEAALRALEESQAAEPTAEDLAEMERSRQEIARGEYVEFDDFAARMRKKHGIPG